MLEGVLQNTDNPLALIALAIIIIGILFKGVFKFKELNGTNSYKVINKIVNYLFFICFSCLVIYGLEKFYQSPTSKEILKEKIEKSKNEETIDTIVGDTIEEKKKEDMKPPFKEMIYFVNVLLSYPPSMIGGEVLVHGILVEMIENKTTRIKLKMLKEKQLIILKKESKRCSTFIEITHENQQIPFLNCTSK